MAEKFTYTPGNPIELIDTTGMSNERWLQIREHGLGKNPMDKDYIPYTITGSGASSALGVNPWVSDEEYRDKKMGFEPKLKTEFNEESKAAGHVFEPFVAINFLRYMKTNFPETKVNLIKDCLRDILPYLSNTCPDKSSYNHFLTNYNEVIDDMQAKWALNPSSMYQCGTKNEDGSLRYPFALANIDGLVDINGKLGIFEAKTTSTRSHAVRDYWEKGIIPPYYYWQVVFYMAVMNVNYAYITCIWGCTMNDMAVIYLDRDLDVERDFMEYLRLFVEDMEMGLPLEESKSDPEILQQYYLRKYGETKGTAASPVELPPYCREYVKELKSLKEEETRATDELNKVKSKMAAAYNKIYAVMQDNKYATITMDDKSVVGVSLKTPMRRAKMDEKRFKEEHPDLYKEFSETTFSWSKLEKKNKAMKRLYALPAEVNAEGLPSFEIYDYTTKAE